MKKFEFTEDYDQYKKGDVIDMKMDIYLRFIHPLLARGVLKVIRSDKKIRDEVEQEIVKIEDEENQLLIDKLLAKKMGELQDFGRKYGARDTSKSELIEEILEKAPLKDIEDYVGDK